MLQSLSWRIETIPNILEIHNLSLGEKFTLIGKFYNKCEKMISSMNKLFAFSFIILLFDCFSMALCTVFLIYDILVHELIKTDLLLFVGGLSYFTISGIVCSTTLNYSSDFETKKKAFLIKINNLQCNNKKSLKMRQISIYQLDVVQIKLSCGIFVLEIPHIFVMISSFFSYLVVTIQFDVLSSDFINKIAGKD